MADLENEMMPGEESHSFSQVMAGMKAKEVEAAAFETGAWDTNSQGSRDGDLLIGSDIGGLIASFRVSLGAVAIASSASIYASAACGLLFVTFDMADP